MQLPQKTSSEDWDTLPLCTETPLSRVKAGYIEGALVTVTITPSWDSSYIVSDIEIKKNGRTTIGTYDGGNIIKKVTKLGKLRRIEIFGFSSGKRISRIDKQDNKHHGDSQLTGWIKGQYEKGKRCGLWKFYHNRQLTETCYYKAGQLTGYTTYYWANQKKRCRLYLINGRPHGWATYWNKDGSLACKRHFRNGLPRKTYKREERSDTEQLKNIRLLLDLVPQASSYRMSCGFAVLGGEKLKIINKVRKLEQAYAVPTTTRTAFMYLANSLG